MPAVLAAVYLVAACVTNGAGTRIYCAKGDLSGPEPDVRVGADTKSESGLNPQQIIHVMSSNLGQVTACYRQELKRDKNAKGTVRVHFTIRAASTRAGGVCIDQKRSSLGSARFHQCVAGKIGGWKFPAPKLPVTIDYPYVFNPF